MTCLNYSFLYVSSQEAVHPQRNGNSRGQMDAARRIAGASISNANPPSACPHGRQSRYLSEPITAMSKSKKSRQFMSKLQRTYMKRSVLMRSLSFPRSLDKGRGKGDESQEPWYVKYRSEVTALQPEEGITQSGECRMKSTDGYRGETVCVSPETLS